MRQPIPYSPDPDIVSNRTTMTPLKRIRGLGSAHEGTEQFIRQRLTAISNSVLILFLTVIAIMLSGRSYAEAVALVGSPWVAIPLGLAFISVTLHLKLGLQVIVEDYIRTDGPRMFLMILIVFFCIAVAATGIYAIVRIMLVHAVGSV